MAGAVAGAYAAKHASALTQVKAKGQAVAFVLRTGTLNEDTGRVANAGTTTIDAFAVRSLDQPRVYEALGLVQTESATLFVVTVTYGDVPPLRASVVVGGVAYTVRSVKPVAPDGVAIASRVVVSR